jgi:ketosteroid isomerase-like protein
MKAMVAPLRTMPNPITEPRYEMINPRVQNFGDVAILTFQVVNYGRFKGKPEAVINRWNSTETYRRTAGRWRIVHSHWSFTTPVIAK